MRILLVTHYYPSHGGGIEVVAGELASRLAAMPGWQVLWFASATDPPPTGTATLACRPIAACNVAERRLGVPFPLWAPAGLAALWRAVGQSDAVHLHDALYFGNACAWLFARMRGVPVIVTQHVGSVPFRSVLLRSIHALANCSLGRLVLATAQQVVFISPAVRDEFARYCRFRAPPVYLSNGVDTAVFCPQGAVADDSAIAAARDSGRRVFLFVGRFVEKKGLHVLRELAAAFPDDLWLCAGYGPLDPAAWALPNVRVVRGERGAGLARYYRAADLLVLPSVGEGFPLVVQEAMACGTPVMVGEDTAAGCPVARPLLFVQQVGTGDTVKRWTQRLAQLRAMPDLLHARRQEVSEFARNNWSWQATASAYAELILTLVRHPATIRPEERLP